MKRSYPEGSILAQAGAPRIIWIPVSPLHTIQATWEIHGHQGNHTQYGQYGQYGQQDMGTVG